LNIFEEVKARVSAKDVAMHYGLKLNRNGMACCPFHDDKHPSMKVDIDHYHCFGYEAHGDAISYVAAFFGIGQYEAACKINEDFALGVETDHRLSDQERQVIERQRTDRARITDIKGHFQEWKRKEIDELLECEQLIEQSEEHLMNADPHVVYVSNGFAYMMHVKAIIGYWLDILCMGSEEEARDFFLTDGKEVSRIVANVKRAGETILGRNSKSA
jgi:hypothetical protein